MAAPANLWARLAAHLPLNIVQACVGFGALAVFSHVLNPDEFGRYALVLSSMALAHTVAFTWIEAAAFRFHPEAKRDNELGDHFATVLKAGGVAALAAAALTLAALAFMETTPTILLAAVLAAIATLARFVSRIARETERANHQVWRYSVMEGAFLAGGFAIGAGAVIGFDFGPAGPFLGLAAIGCALALIDLPRLIAAGASGAAKRARLLCYAGYGAPLALALVLDLATQTATRFALESAAGPAAVGAFAAGYGLSGRILDLVFLWAGMAAAPLTLSAYETAGETGAKAAAGKLFSALIVLGAPAAAGLALVGKELAALMIGPGLRAETTLTLAWFALSGLLSGLTLYYFCEAFNLTRRTALRAALMVGPAIVAVGLTLIWAPTYGALGAAWALTASSGFGLIVMALVGRGLLRLPAPPIAIAKVALGVAAMSAAVAATPGLDTPFATLIAKAFVGAMVYGLLLFALDFSNVRSTVSAVWQRIHAKVSSSAVEAQP
ncbi:MAG: polysaccharide biosynthesis C-terminal domain-containing protein [Caulobacterales bacterium]|jgi:O-antigen/teichoic acid export membrane protein